MVPKTKKVSKWLSDKAVEIADKRRKTRNQGDDYAYRRLNAAFHRSARKDKEMSLHEKCRQREHCYKTGRTRDIFKQIRDITGSFNAIRGATKGSLGNVVSEDKAIKEI